MIFNCQWTAAAGRHCTAFDVQEEMPLFLLRLPVPVLPARKWPYIHVGNVNLNTARIINKFFYFLA
jgi:hypothetical protein